MWKKTDYRQKLRNISKNVDRLKQWAGVERTDIG
jgi:hypothetical protein